MKFRILACTIAATIVTPAAAKPIAADPAGDRDFRALFQEMVETDSSFPDGDCTKVVQQVSARMVAAGFPASQLHLMIPEDHPKAGNLVAVFPGRVASAKAVMMLAHIDVVTAKRADWTRDPFKLVEENGYYFARGTADMKAQAAIWVDNLIRYNREKFRPRRTIKMALTCGEEQGFFNGANWLTTNHRDLVDAGIALNEGGSGQLDGKGRPIAHIVEFAEKTGMVFTLVTKNPGGHSAFPRPDNAINSLVRGLDRISRYTFPLKMIDANRAYFAQMAQVVGGENGRAMAAIARDPSDKTAEEILSRSPVWNAELRTTCIVTTVQGGHAMNALPQRAQAEINCRAVPGTDPNDIKVTLEKLIDDPAVAVSAPWLPFPIVEPSAVTARVLDPVKAVSAQIWPGTPVVPFMITGSTDSNFFNAAGIPAYGISGLFRDPDENGMHGLNERIGVKSLNDARQFLYRLVRIYADQPD